MASTPRRDPGLVAHALAHAPTHARTLSTSVITVATMDTMKGRQGNGHHSPATAPTKSSSASTLFRFAVASTSGGSRQAHPT